MKVQKPNWFSAVEVRDLIQRRPWSILSWAAGVVALAFIGYYGILSIDNPPANIGAQFVGAEFPPPSLSPWFYGKPITWFIYAAYLALRPTARMGAYLAIAGFVLVVVMRIALAGSHF